MPELEDIETFNVVATAGGLSPAARRLGVSKSVVSRRLQRLETELGVQLLARTTRGAGLTEAGMTFRVHAAQMSSEMDAAREALALTGDLRGRFRIAAPLSFGPTHMAPILAELARLHPRLHVHASYTDRIVDLVVEGFDAAIRVGYLADSRLVARRIGSVCGTLVASPAYVAEHGAPSSPDELLEHQALMQGTESWRFIVGKKTVTVRPQGRFKADNGLALEAAAVAGLGIAYLPGFLVEAHIASGALVAVMKRYPIPDGGIFLVRPPNIQPSRKLKALTDLLLARFGNSDCR